MWKETRKGTIVFGNVPKDRLHVKSDIYSVRDQDRDFVRMRNKLISDIKKNGLKNPLCCKHTSKLFKVTIGKQRLNALHYIDTIQYVPCVINTLNRGAIDFPVKELYNRDDIESCFAANIVWNASSLEFSNFKIIAKDRYFYDP